ncbi:hypothetical protein, partial [Salmonella enterica]|uniref:hypothetical protein n=1 Tax=Salmonella enterica TaxID=28901 RepID=UPI00329A55CD
AQGFAEVLDNILGNTGQHIATLRNLAQEFFPVWNSVVDTFGNLRDIVSTLGPLAGVVLSGGLRLVWEAVQLLAPALASITGYLAVNEWAVYTLVGALAAWKKIMLANSAILAVQG